MQAYGYIRVSHPSQATTDRDGYERQRAAIENYAGANGFEIVRWFQDAISGTTEHEDRPACAEMMEEIRTGGALNVIIEKLDRLARDVVVQEVTIRTLQQLGCGIHSTIEPDLGSSDPTRVLMRQIVGAMAQYDRANIVHRLRVARGRAKAKNPSYREGRKPYGFRPGEAETIKIMQLLRDEYHYGYEHIAAYLNKNGVKTRYGDPWFVSSVWKILNRVNGRWANDRERARALMADYVPVGGGENGLTNR